MIQLGRVSHVRAMRYGKKLIENVALIDETEFLEFDIPHHFEFNSSWKILHECLSCGKEIEIDQNFEESTTNFSVKKKFDSFHYSVEFLMELERLFNTVELVKIQGVTYLNRTDFEYSFDFQRKASVHVSHYSCASCHADYLGLLRIGSPLAPEKGLEHGRVGRVEITEIVHVKCAEGFDEYRSRQKRHSLDL